MMLRNNRGFTAIEVAIGIGVVAVLTTAVLTTQLMVTQDQVKLRNQMEESIDTNLAERVLFSDLNAIDPSYNNLTIQDDAGLPFFEFYPDVPASMLATKIDRNISLKLNGRTELYVLLQDVNAGPLMTYDPVAAYNIGAAPDDFNTSASVTFSSLNRDKWVERQRPGFWVNGKLLMLDTPARLRPLKADGSLDMSVPPRSPIYIGSVDNLALKQDPTIQNLVNSTDPETGASIISADVFLRNLPSIGGGQSIVRLRAVRLVKYYLMPQTDNRYAKQAAYLYKSVYENSKWSEPFLMADGVESFELKRDSVLKRMIYFKIRKMKKLNPNQTASL